MNARNREDDSPMPDHDLLERYRSGDCAALDALIERYRRPLYGFILNMTDRPGDADDIFQDVWLRALRSMDGYQERGFMSWLVRIARNLMIDRFRKRRPEVSFEQENDRGGSLEHAVPDPGPGPGDEFAAGEVALCIRNAVENLPVEQKEVFLMRVEAELPFKEIAVIQGVSISTALARMQYALAKLRSKLAERETFAEAGS